MNFKQRTVRELAAMICGSSNLSETHFIYRSSSYLTEFFQDCGTEFTHDGTSRVYWVADRLKEILQEPQTNPDILPETFSRVITRLMDQGDATNETSERQEALRQLNITLAREGYEAFYAEDKQCYLRHSGSKAVIGVGSSPHRPFTKIEIERRNLLKSYLAKASEDDLIDEILVPLFRQLGFHRVTATGHRDKQLEYGKDLWMKFALPTQHILYFGIQAKKGRVDASGVSKGESGNIAEIYNQVCMMLGHEIFDPEIGKRVLVDHTFIIAGGEITKAAKNWLGNKLDASKRSQVMFIDREDILNLYTVTNLPLPSEAFPKHTSIDDIPPF
jgi:hypothetical protein